MRVEVLNHEKIKDFVEYCKKHRRGIEDSFLYHHSTEYPSSRNMKGKAQ
ncbi:hypothetical protein [Neobacillus niacini]|nr:hypothetical protein [Neobacillus niacini]MDR7003091.1 hypothetical protein [Neobacillus niacini]